MTLKVVFRRAARAEFDAAALWYGERRKILGSQFVAEIDRTVALAAQHPERFPAKPW
jgi:plasmid stabilization system protein ParE